MSAPLHLDPELHEQLEEVAARTGSTVAELVAEAVRSLLGTDDVWLGAFGASAVPLREAPSALVNDDSGFGGVDLADTAALVELLEREPS